MHKFRATRTSQWFNLRRRDDIRASTTVDDRNEQSDLPGDLLTSTRKDDSFMHRANNVMRQTLPVVSAIAPVIPVAGPRLKASIDGLLVVLNAINVSQRVLENILHV